MLLLCSYSLSSYADAGYTYYLVKGVVIDPSGSPAANKEMVMQGVRLTPHRLVRTDSAGRFTAELPIFIPCMSGSALRWGSDSMRAFVAEYNDSNLSFYCDEWMGVVSSGWWNHWLGGQSSDDSAPEQVTVFLGSHPAPPESPLEGWSQELKMLQTKIQEKCLDKKSVSSLKYPLLELIEFRGRTVSELRAYFDSFQCPDFVSLQSTSTPNELELIFPSTPYYSYRRFVILNDWGTVVGVIERAPD